MINILQGMQIVGRHREGIKTTKKDFVLDLPRL